MHKGFMVNAIFKERLEVIATSFGARR